MESKRHRSRGSLRAVFAAATLLAACASPPSELTIDEQVDLYLTARRQRIRAAADDFRERVKFPRVEKFEQGTVILTRGELFGPLDHESLSLQVTYLNESDQTYDRIRLHFSVVDPAGRTYGRKDIDFVMPADYRFSPGNSYMDTVHVPTGGAHDVPGFDVRVELSAETW